MGCTSYVISSCTASLPFQSHFPVHIGSTGVLSSHDLRHFIGTFARKRIPAPLMEQVKVPVMIIHAEHDLHTSPMVASEEWRDALPNGVLSCLALFAGRKADPGPITSSGRRRYSCRCWCTASGSVHGLQCLKVRLHTFTYS